jgi:prepilin-type N-terminal cleavage/methylation domain-containing protein
MKPHPFRRAACPARRPAGFTLIELLVVMGIVTVLVAVLLPSLNLARGRSNRAKCANNLRQIALAALAYANKEVRTGAFPRTYYDTAGGSLMAGTFGYGQAQSFSTLGPIPLGANNVTASFFLILKTQEVSPDTFICPDSGGQPGFPSGSPVSVQESSNWASIPLNLSYSYNCPFPTRAALDAGWRFNNSLGGEFVLAADMNPGNVGGPPGNTNQVVHVVSDHGRRDMARGNSNNHQNTGQNVAYCDAHVEFHDTPFCGPQRTGVGAPPYRDHIYTTGRHSSSDTFSSSSLPVDAHDVVLFPSDDPGGTF